MRSHDQTRDERRRIYLNSRQDSRVISLPYGMVYFVPAQKLMTPEQGDRALRIYRNEIRPYHR
jgi:hypothetical protein